MNPPAAAATPPAGAFARDTATLAVGLAAAQLIGWAVLPVWSRLYGAAEFAALGLFTAVASVVSMLLLLRYDTAVVVARDDADARAVVRLVLAISLGVGMPLVLLAAALPRSWLDAAGLGPLGRWLPLAVASGAMAAVLAAGLAWANRQRAYRRISVARIVLAVGTAAGGTLLASRWPDGGLLLAQLLAALLAIACVGWSLQPHSGARRAARVHRAAPRWLWPAAMLDAVTQQIPIWLTSWWFGADAAGQFSLAWRVVALPALMLASAAGSVFYQRLAAIAAEVPTADRPRSAAARALVRRTWKAFALVGALPAIALVAFGGPLFAAGFGAPWAPAGVLAAALAPMLLGMLVSSPTSGALIVLGLHRRAPWFGLAMLAYRPLAFGIGAAAGSLVLALVLWAAFEIIAIVVYNRMLLAHLAVLDHPRSGI